MSKANDVIKKVSEAMKGFNVTYQINVDKNGNLPDGAKELLDAAKDHKTEHGTENPDFSSIEISYPKGTTKATFNIEGKEYKGEASRYSLPTIAVRLLTNGESLIFESAGKYFGFSPGTGEDAKQLLAEVKARNIAAGWQTEEDFQTKRESDHLSESPIIALAPNYAGDRATMALLYADECLMNTETGDLYHKAEGVTAKYHPNELFTDDWWADCQEATLEALRKRFSNIKSDLTADVWEILFSHWYRHRRKDVPADVSAKAMITLRDICHYRGIEPRGRNLQMAYLAMRDIRALSLQDGTFDDHIFDIAVRNPQLQLPQINWESDKTPDGNTFFVYSPGYFIEKTIGNNPLFLAPYDKRFWKLDPKTHPKEKRLARYLPTQWRMNLKEYLSENPKQRRYQTWETILNAAHISYASEGERNPGRFISTMEKVVCELYDKELTNNEGMDIYHPDDQPAAQNLPARGKLKSWLALRVCIIPAADIADELKKIHKKRIGYMARKELKRNKPAKKLQNK